MTDQAAVKALHWARLKVFLSSSGQRKYWRQRVAELEAQIASGIEARQGGDACGSVHESPVAKPDAQTLPGDHP